MASSWALGYRKQLPLQSQTGENGSMEGICYLLLLPPYNGTGLTSPVLVMPHVHLHSNSNFGLVLSLPKLQGMALSAFGFFLRNNQHTKKWQDGAGRADHSSLPWAGMNLPRYRTQGQGTRWLFSESNQPSNAPHPPAKNISRKAGY